MELLEIVVDNLIERENDMSNYVWNKVICDKETLEKYFIDNNPFGDEIIEKPYITFNKIFGMRLTNCFPTNLGPVETSDEEVDQLSRFSVEFTYSDVEPIKNESYIRKVVDTILGNDGKDIINGVRNLNEGLLD